MALQFLDSFDGYATAQLAARYSTVSATSPTISSGQSRTGAQSLAFADSLHVYYVTKTVSGSPGRLIMGFAFLLGAVAGGQKSLCKFINGSTTQITVALQTDNTLRIYRGSFFGGTLLGSISTAVASTSGWNYIEVDVTFATGATGSVTVYLNGASIGSLTSVQTATTSAVATSVSLSGQASDTNDQSVQGFFDDFYVFDSTGTLNNAPAGDSKIVLMKPNGAGHVGSWTTTGAANDYTATSEIPPDGDTSYIASASVGAQDIMALSSLGTVASVKAVQVSAYARKDDATTRTLGLVVSDGTTDSVDAGQNLSTSYAYYQRALDKNPITALAWATGDFTGGTALQAGCKVIA